MLRVFDGSELLVGEMAARRAGAGERALFVVAAGDPTDERKADHEIVFQSAHQVAAVGTTGKMDVVKHTDGRHSFRIQDNEAVLVILR